MTRLRYVSTASLHRFLLCVFDAAGLDTRQAEDSAQGELMWASQRGVDTHGVRNLQRYYIAGLDDGSINPEPNVRILRESSVSANVDGDRGIGLAAACWAMRLALEKAADWGVGLVAMKNSHHFGAAGCYAEMAADRNMIGVCMTGCFFPRGQDKAVSPYGGRQPMLSTNPLAFACPCFEKPPFVLDFSTSVVPINRLELLEELGETIPPGWAFDRAGRPATDPSNVHRLAPLGGDADQGGHKGYGLALMVQILTGVLSGAWCEVQEVPENLYGDNRLPFHGFIQEGVAHCFAAIQIDTLISNNAFRRAMDAMLEALQQSAPLAEGGRVMVAGQREFETACERSRTGIPITPRAAAELQALALRFDAPLEWMNARR